MDEYNELLAEIWQSRMLSNFGKFAQRIEALATSYLGVPTRAVVSGDIGLVIALAAFQLPKGASVVVPSFTFNSTVNAVIWNGLQPVFADIDAEMLTLDPQSAAEAITRWDAQAIIATHVFGNPADVGGLQHVAANSGARVLYDAAHAYGSRHRGQQVGNFGDAEVFSLSGTKLVTSAEGGLIATTDRALLERVDYLRAYGFRNDYNSRYVGLNGKMSELHAALGTLTLREVDGAVEKRKEMADRYRGAFADVEIAFQSVHTDDRSTFKDFAVIFRDGTTRARAEAVLAEAGIQTKRYFRPCHTQDAYAQLPRLSLANTDDIYDRILCIPIFAAMTSHEMDRVIQATRAAVS